MGLFVLPESDSKEDLIKAAIENLQLYLNEIDKHNHLLDFAINQINQVRIKEVIHNGKSICN